MANEELNNHHINLLRDDNSKVAIWPISLSMFQIFSSEPSFGIEHWWSNNALAVVVVLLYAAFASFIALLFSRRLPAGLVLSLNWIAWALFLYLVAYEEQVVLGFLSHPFIFAIIGKIWVVVVKPRYRT